MKIVLLFKQFYKNPWDRGLMVLILLLTGLIGFQSLTASQSDAPVVTETSISPDDLIPSGFVLVPIQLENHSSIDSVVGAQSIVNLYRILAGDKESGSLIGRNLRMLRAPLNPQQFAVLVPESDVGRFISYQGQLHAVLQNRVRNSHTEFSQKKSSTKIQFF